VVEMARKGWHKEPARHSLAARGMKTPRKSWNQKRGASIAKNFQYELGNAAGTKEPEVIIWPNPRANRLAEAVLGWFKFEKDEIDAQLKRNKSDQNLLIVPFLNGRERGYTARLGDKEVSWCEHRNVDNITVYPFDWFGVNVDEDYKTKTMDFKKDDGEAYKWICKYLGIPLSGR